MLTSCDTAMLVTQTSDEQLRSRPMAVADIHADCSVWFVTS
ncbi:MAG: pyridoxamine 5'-phosphate oxidase family protein [Planctomycetaceae bacterium]|nr:pyridoxamine 5'-phosphate oxidase family protein [Planctomycetaceae bacterium]